MRGPVGARCQVVKNAWIQDLTPVLVTGLLSVLPATARAAPPKPETLEAWGAYVTREEQRIERELAEGGDTFLVFDRLGSREAAAAMQRLLKGEVAIVPRGETGGHGSGASVPSGLVHHWLGAVLIPGATVEQVLAFVQDYDNHAPYFTEVLASKLLERSGDRFTIYLKLERKKVITVRYATEHVVEYRRVGARAASVSRAQKIAELTDVGTAREREKSPADDRGFLWRLNSYWRFEPRPEGVVLECESISLSRDVPRGLGWLVNGFVKGISRESLERTLASIRDAVLSRRSAPGARS